MGLGHLTIGVSTTLCRYRLLPYLKTFIAQYPHISINISCQSTNHTLDMLRDGSIDLGLVAKPEDTGHISFVSQGRIEDVFVCTPSYLNNLQMRTQVSGLDLLNAGTLMLLDKANASRQFIDYFLEENHIHASNLIEITTMDLLIEFARTGLGIACVIRDFVADDLKSGLLVEIPTPQAIHRERLSLPGKKADHPTVFSTLSLISFLSTENSIAKSSFTMLFFTAHLKLNIRFLLSFTIIFQDKSLTVLQKD